MNKLENQSLVQYLLGVADKPPKVNHDEVLNKDYLICDYNRYENSYQSTYENLPSNSLRQLEIETNQIFEQYYKMYFEGAISSVYFLACENGFIRIILNKKFYDQISTNECCWDSIHVVAVKEKHNDHSAHYKLTSMVMLWLQKNTKMFGVMSLARKLVQQLESDHQLTDFGQHIVNIHTIVNRMENKINHIFNSIYYEETKNTSNGLYDEKIIQDHVCLQDNFAEDQKPHFYWKILAEYAREKLIDQFRECQQLHELVDELNEQYVNVEKEKDTYKNILNDFHLHQLVYDLNKQNVGELTKQYLDVDEEQHVHKNIHNLNDFNIIDDMHPTFTLMVKKLIEITYKIKKEKQDLEQQKHELEKVQN